MCALMARRMHSAPRMRSSNLHFDASLEFVAERGRRSPLPELIGALVVSVLVAAASIAGIALPAAYAQEAPSWAAQGIGQDLVDIFLAVPLLVWSAILALRGSRRATFVLAGGLAYTVYELVIYAFCLRFNALFLIYCGVLGSSFFALAGVMARLARRKAARWFAEPIPVRVTGAFLIAVGAGFYALWLGDVVPALVSGTVPKAIVEAGTATNPVYVMDLSIVLPLHIIAGISLLRQRPLGLVLAPVVLAFGSLMALSIAAMIVVMRARGLAGSYGIVAAMGALSAASALLLGRLLRCVPG
jgi:hypothetical protein